MLKLRNLSFGWSPRPRAMWRLEAVRCRPRSWQQPRRKRQRHRRTASPKGPPKVKAARKGNGRRWPRRGDNKLSLLLRSCCCEVPSVAFRLFFFQKMACRFPYPNTTEIPSRPLLRGSIWRTRIPPPSPPRGWRRAGSAASDPLLAEDPWSSESIPGPLSLSPPRFLPHTTASCHDAGGNASAGPRPTPAAQRQRQRAGGAAARAPRFVGQ